MGRSRNLNKVFIKERLIMKKFAIFATYFCLMTCIFTSNASYSQEVDDESQISGTINFDEIREKYEKQHEWKIHEHNYFFNQFLKFYEDSSVFPLIFIGDFEARIYYMNLQTYRQIILLNQINFLDSSMKFYSLTQAYPH